jgi:subtilisin family serine protease
VIFDASVDWLPDVTMVELDPESIGSDETYFDLFQWSMLAIDAPGAWDAGYTGAGARVVVMDTGIDPNHPDLAPNLNVPLSRSYVPEEPFIDDLHSHGSNVAGIIAGADNGYGIIGVAPDAEVVAFKVLSGSGSGDFSWIIAGLYDAVEIEADVVNMSLGAYMDKGGFYDDDGVWVSADEIAEFLNLLKKAINYADANGVTVVASAGNNALDGQGDAGLLHIPSDLGAAICVSATGPLGWWNDPTTNLDELAYYSNYGPQIDFAAPGGNLDPSLPWPFPAAYDLVFGCFAGGFGWMGGTSQAAPHVAGVAALIVGKNGGDMRPQHVLSELRRSADDLGKPGEDVYYGHGRVNAARAVAP